MVSYAASGRVEGWRDRGMEEYFQGRTAVAHQVKGVIAKAKGKSVSIDTVLVPDPGPGEALVRVKTCGVCHTDLHYREGAINNDFPFLLGHEAAGTVEKV